ncbi:MAG: tetratricopeptide repeat protein [Candidatus Sericytochromatia bacterium]
MLSLEYVKRIDCLMKILEVLDNSGMDQMKQEVDNNHSKYLKFVSRYFYGGRKTDDEKSALLDEFRQLRPLNNSFFRKHYRDIIRVNSKIEVIISELTKGDIESTGLDKMLVICKQIEDFISNMEETDSFSLENVNELNKYLNEYRDIKNSIINLRDVYKSFVIEKELPKDYNEIEVSFYTDDNTMDNYSSRLLSLKLIYEILMRLNNITENNTNKFLVIKSEKEDKEYYKLAGLKPIISDLQFLLKEWLKDYVESESPDINNIVSFKIDSRIKYLVDRNQINSDMADKYYNVIKRALKNIQLDKCTSIDLNSEHLVISKADSDNFKKLTEQEIKSIIDEKRPPKTYNEIMVENKESDTLKKIESNLLNSPIVDENYTEDLFKKGVTLLSIKRYSESLEFFDKLLKLKPNDAEAYNYKAHVYTQLGNFSEAIKLADKAIELKENYREAYLNKGTALFMMSRYAEALIQYHKTIQIDKNYAEGYFNLGSCYMMIEGKKKEAIQAFTKALEITPNYPEALYNRACAYVSQSYFDECIRDLETAVGIDKNYKSMLKIDKDFSPIHESQKFKSLIA